MPEANDLRILEAASRITRQEIAKVILLGNPDEVLALASHSNISLQGCRILDIASSDLIGAYAEMYADRRQVKLSLAKRALAKPLYFAAMMVRADDADVLLAGIENPTRRVIEAARLCIGLAHGIQTPSSFFVMVPRDMPPLIFADCAINVDPTAGQLADIAIASAGNADKLLKEPPRVALLSFSTKGSANHARTNKVVRALEKIRDRVPALVVDGELQADSALVPEIAKLKISASNPVGGRANVLIFPDLDAANIAYKLVQHIAHAKAIGPILQGFARPVADLSRGASVDDVVAAVALSVAMSG